MNTRSIFKDKAIRKGIIASLIATVVFIIILEPLMKLLWGYINTKGSFIYSSYLDSLYKTAALGHRNNLDFIFDTKIELYIFLVLIMFSIFTFLKIKSIKNNIEVNDIEDKVERDKRINELYGKDIIKENFFINHLIVLKYSYISLFLIFFFTFSSSTFRNYADLQLNTSFRQRMDAICPYLEDKESKIIISKWALMKSKKDYFEINKILEDKAKENNIKLPVELLK